MEEKELKKALSTLGDEIDEKLEKLTAKTKELSKDEARNAIKEVKADLEGEIKKYNDLNTEMQKQLDAIDTKMKRLNGDAELRKSFRTLLTDKLMEKMGEGKDARKLKGSILEFDKKTAYEITSDGSGDGVTNYVTGYNSTAVVPVQYQPGIVYDPTRVTHVRDLISQGTTTSNTVAYVQEYSLTDGSGTTDEGATYNQSDFTLKRVDAVVTKLTTYLIISDEMLEDVEGLTSYITTRLPEKLRAYEDTWLLEDATYGILTKGTAYVDDLADSTINRYDILCSAAEQIVDDEYRPTAIMMHPGDVLDMKLEKDSNGQYIMPWIFMNGGIAVDGLPVVQSTAIDEGTFLVGDFKRGAQVFDRRQLSIEFSNSNDDNFIKGMVTVRISERIALVVYRPKCFVYGTFAAALANGSA